MEKSILNIVRKYGRELKKNRVRIKGLYLFGSRAGKTARSASDIDVAVISDSLSGDWFEDVKLLHRLRRNVDLRIEPVPISAGKF